jgi:flagellin
MAFSINTNLAGMTAHSNLSKTDRRLTETLERLSTGLRINKAADDASGMVIADGFRAQSLGLGQAIKNATDGISLVQIADGSLNETVNILNTIRTKAVQAASDGQTTQTRQLIQTDINRLLEELNAIAKNTAFNGQKLLSGAFTNKVFQVGANSYETLNVSIASAEATKIGHVSTANLQLASPTGGDVQLTVTSSITGEQLTLNNVNIQFNNKAENGMGALSDEINRFAATTGIKATAQVSVTSANAVASGNTGASFAINGITIGDITTQNNDSDSALRNAINGKETQTGVTASISTDGKLILTSKDGRAIQMSGEVSGVLGSTAGQMSTLGYIVLIQSGVSQFQISGIGAGATGANITISGDITTATDSVLAAGSKIGAGSKLSVGTVVGGDAVVESTVTSTQLDTSIESGSTVYAGSIIAKGTQLSGNAVVSGNTLSTSLTLQTLAQDMLATAGTQLRAGSVLGKGSVVSTQFTVGTTTYTVGQTLAASVTLSSDLSLTADMTLKFSNTALDNTRIAANSILATGSQLGADFNIGLVRDTSAGNITAGTATGSTTAAKYVIDDITSGNTTDFTIKAGSLLKSGSVLTLGTASSATYNGPTLVHSSGTLTRGDAVSGKITITLSGDQVLSGDVATGTGVNVIGSGSILTAGFTIGSQAASAGSYVNVTMTNLLLADDMTLKSGSRLQAQSTLLAGSILGSDTRVHGGTVNTSAQALTTIQTTQLKAGSVLESDFSTNRTVLATGSTVGGAVTTSELTTIASDMTLKAGSILKTVSTGTSSSSFLKAGTVISQDMVLNFGFSGNASQEVSVSAGDVLTTDLWVDGLAGDGVADVTISTDLLVKKDSRLAGNSRIAVNTTNAGTVGLDDTLFNRLSDLNVLTSAGAQLAIDITDAALKDIDNVRSSLGSVQNQITSTIANLSVTATNVTAAESAIRDVDFAQEAGNFSKLQVLAQAGSFALAQANASAQLVLSLLQ